LEFPVSGQGEGHVEGPAGPHVVYTFNTLILPPQKWHITPILLPLTTADLVRTPVFEHSITVPECAIRDYF